MTRRRIGSQDYLQDAYGKDGYTSEHQNFMMELSTVAANNEMEEFSEILDPQIPDPCFNNEGWYLKRKLESVEEINKRIDIIREIFPDRKDDLLKYAEANVELPEWPENARFKLRIDPAIWGDTNGQPDYYYNSQTFKELIIPLVESYRKFNPEKGELVDNILRCLNYWVKLDSPPK